MTTQLPTNSNIHVFWPETEKENPLIIQTSDDGSVSLFQFDSYIDLSREQIDYLIKLQRNGTKNKNI